MKPRFFQRSIWMPALLLASCIAGAGEPKQPALHVMPAPKSLTWAPGRLSIDSSFRVRLAGAKDARLPGAVARMLQRLQKKTGIPFQVTPAPAPGKATLDIHCLGAGEPVQSPRADESYALDVSGQGARLEAPSPIGVLRGLETFLQLTDADDQSFFVPAVQIRDEPRFCWRGLHIDVSRHWEPVDIIKRNLDAMAAVKLNVLHWHLSDDQGFRVESARFPRLHKVASEGNYYTQLEVREIIAYARDRGIRIVPEFDVPGHTTAWLSAYPELASAPGPYSIERSWGIFDPCMDPSSKKVYEFLDAFIDEMAGLFPDEYFHIGGDEVNGKQWNASSAIRAFKAQKRLADNQALHAYFNRRLQRILDKHHKKMIGWDEILHPDLPKTAVIQSWRGHSYLARSARQGNAGILSFGYYLDHMRPASYLYENDPLGKEASNLTDGEKSLILGGEACMWGEFVTPDNIESRIWPRAAAIAERLWSPREINDPTDMYRRLEFVSSELAMQGLMHRVRYVEMLQRIAGIEDLDSLKILADLLKPAAFGVRVKTRSYSSLTPLNRMADAVWPESVAARKFGDRVSSALASASVSTEEFLKIRKLLSDWKDNAAALKPAASRLFLLQEIGPLADIFIECADTGLQALDYIESRRKPAREWQEKAASTLTLAEKPHAEMLIAITPAVQALVQAAIALP